jgi:hypothetical protein
MSSIIPFSAGAKLPAYMANRASFAAINKEVATGSAYTSLSIKGKVFTLVRDSERKVMTRPDDADEVLQSLTLTAVRANKNCRTFYSKAYDDEESKAAPPTCFSFDGVSPDAGANEPQAKKCAACANNVWGDTPNGKGTKCASSTRLAVIDSEHLGEPMLLRVPPASRTAFNDTVKAAIARGIPYNALALKVSFDTSAATPKLVFKISGLVNDAAYARITELYDSELVGEIVGTPAEHGPVSVALPAPSSDADDELDAALEVRAAVATAKTKPVAKPVAKVAPVAVVQDEEEEEEEEVAEVAAPAPKPAVKAVAKPAPVAKPSVDADDDLLADLDSLLSNTDD